MDASVVIRQLLRAPRHSVALPTVLMPPQSRAVALLHPANLHPSHFQHRHLSIPRIITPSFWSQLIPKPLRQNPLSSSEREPRKEWNPATPFMILGLLVGSQAIQILWLKRDRERFRRKAEAKIGILREVVEKVKRGEDVDVEKVLGTGDKAMEKEWEDILKQIGDEEVLYKSKKRRAALRAKDAEEEGREAAAKEAEQTTTDGKTATDDGKSKVETFQGAKFY